MLDHRFATLLVFLATLALSVVLFVIIPKGFFPQQDTGLITGISEIGQDTSFAELARHQAALGEVVLQGPRHRSRRHGGGRQRQSAQYRPHVHHAEAA